MLGIKILAECLKECGVSKTKMLIKIVLSFARCVRDAVVVGRDKNGSKDKQFHENPFFS